MREILYQQLKLMDIYKDEFLEKLGGEKGLFEKINKILDEINWIRQELKKLEE